eukprot:7142980-Pyramimonas_sp.AAC.1
MNLLAPGAHLGRAAIVLLAIQHHRSGPLLPVAGLSGHNVPTGPPPGQPPPPVPQPLGVLQALGALRVEQPHLRTRASSRPSDHSRGIHPTTQIAQHTHNIHTTYTQHTVLQALGALRVATPAKPCIVKTVGSFAGYPLNDSDCATYTQTRYTVLHCAALCCTAVTVLHCKLARRVQTRGVSFAPYQTV